MTALGFGVAPAAAQAAPTAPMITSPTEATTTLLPTITGTGLVAEDPITVTYTAGGGSASANLCPATVVVTAALTFSCPVTTQIPAGQVTLTVTETEATVSPTSSVSVAVGVSAVITSPAAGSTTTNQTPTISGTGQPADTVAITNTAGTMVCPATVSATGTFSCAPSTPLAAGPTTLIVTETVPNTDPVVSGASPAVAVTIGATGSGGTTTGTGSTTAAGSSTSATTAASTAGASSAAAMPSSVSSGSGGAAAPRGMPDGLVAGLCAGGLLLLGVVWRRRRQG